MIGHLLSLALLFQGRDGYFNLDNLGVKPIAIGAAGSGEQFLLVCNTPDSSLELYRLDGNHANGEARRDRPAFEARIPVGLEPVSVAYHAWPQSGGAGPGDIPSRHMVYVVNALGDSLTILELLPAPERYRVVDEVRVTAPLAHQHPNVGQPAYDDLRGDDEPLGVAIVEHATKPFLVVTKKHLGAVALLDPIDGSPLNVAYACNSCFFEGGVNVVLTGKAVGVGAWHDTTDPFESWRPKRFGPGNSEGEYVLSRPRVAAKRPGVDEVWVLAQDGSSAHAPDLWGMQFAPITRCGSTTECGLENQRTTTVNLPSSTNFALAFAPAGDKLYVVGTEGLVAGVGDAALRELNTQASGFVKSMLYELDLATQAIASFDLNALANGGPVPKSSSLAHPTDVALYRHPVHGTLHALVTAFHSDRVAVVDLAPAFSQASIHRENVEGGSGNASEAAGPRALALLEDPDPTRVRCYTLNVLDTSVTVLRLVDAVPPESGQRPLFEHRFPLHRSLASTPPVVPAHVSNGRKYFYSTQYSGSGLVSCASCHVDGQSDHLAWCLSAPPTFGAKIPLLPRTIPAPANRLEADCVLPATRTELETNGMPVDSPFPAGGNAKGRMVTPSLRGLLPFACGPDSLFAAPTDNLYSALVSGAPYGYRGERDSLRHYNYKFVSLLGRPLVSPPPPEPAGGLGAAQSKDLEAYLNSLRVPPNPWQREERLYSGTSWLDTSSTDPQQAGAGSEAHLGLKLFHILPLEREVEGSQTSDGRSCVHCHALPTGSNRRATWVVTPQFHTPPPLYPNSPLRTPELVDLMDRDGMWETNGYVPLPAAKERLRIGSHGLGHSGQYASSRNEGVLAYTGFASDTIGRHEQRSAVVQYLREFDPGVAPIVGRTAVLRWNWNEACGTAPCQAEEEQLFARILEQAKLGNCGVAAHLRRLSPQGTTIESSGYWLQLYLGLGFHESGSAGVVIPVEALKSPFGNADPDDGELLIVRATPLGMERRIASLTGVPDTLTLGPLPTVEIVGTTPNTANLPLDTDPLVVNWNPAPSGESSGDCAALDVPFSYAVTRAFQQSLGLPVRHEAPRRLQVKGTGLRQGAVLRIELLGDCAPPETCPPLATLELPIHPTKYLCTSDRLWETDVEFAPLSLYQLIAGGPGKSAVRTLLATASGTVTPALVRVSVGLDGTFGPPTHQLIPFANANVGCSSDE